MAMPSATTRPSANSPRPRNDPPQREDEMKREAKRGTVLFFPASTCNCRHTCVIFWSPHPPSRLPTHFWCRHVTRKKGQARPVRVMLMHVVECLHFSAVSAVVSGFSCAGSPTGRNLFAGVQWVHAVYACVCVYGCRKLWRLYQYTCSLTQKSEIAAVYLFFPLFA